MWSPYHGTQTGDPAKLGEALVKVAGMENPPRLFVAGSDALAVITPAIEERLKEARANEDLSKSTDGSVQNDTWGDGSFRGSDEPEGSGYRLHGDQS